MAEKIWWLCKTCGKKFEDSFIHRISCHHCGALEDIYQTKPPIKRRFFESWNWGPFYKPVSYAMRRYQVWWVLTKCFFGKHYFQGNYGAHSEGWGTKHVCWWCGKEQPGMPSFIRDKEVDPIPGPLPSCHQDHKNTVLEKERR